MSTTFQKGQVNDCCKQKINLYLAHKDEKQRLAVWRCKFCGRNHYVVEAEPGRFGFMR